MINDTTKLKCKLAVVVGQQDSMKYFHFCSAAPNDKMKDILMRTISEAKAAVSKVTSRH